MGGKETAEVKGSEAGAGDAVQGGGQGGSVAGSGWQRSRLLGWGRTWWKPFLILTPLPVVCLTTDSTCWVFFHFLQWNSFKLNLLEA